jgi:hypothetical protein
MGPLAFALATACCAIYPVIMHCASSVSMMSKIAVEEIHGLDDTQ